MPFLARSYPLINVALLFALSLHKACGKTISPSIPSQYTAFKTFPLIVSSPQNMMLRQNYAHTIAEIRDQFACGQDRCVLRYNSRSFCHAKGANACHNSGMPISNSLNRTRHC